MKHFFSRLPLPYKLLLIGLVPLLLLVYMTVQLYENKNRELALLHSYLDRITQSVNLNKLIDQLQTERRHSFSFVLEGKGKEALLTQRLETDKALQRLDDSNQSTLYEYRKYTFLDKLLQTRNAIDSGRSNSSAVIQYYTNAIYRLNTLNVVSVGNNSYLQPVYQDLTAQQALSQMVTFYGIIANNLYSVLFTKKYMLETLIGTVGVYQVNETYKTEFLLKASPEVAASYSRALTKPTLQTTVAFIDTVFKTFQFDSAMTAPRWQEISLQGIDVLKELQQGMLKNVEAQLNMLYKESEAERDRTLLLLIVMLVLVFALIGYIIFIISKTLSELKGGAKQLARGASGLRFPPLPNDVIGSLGQSILEIDENNQTLARAAAEIGKGNFTIPLVPRSEEDLLGNALGLMKENLQRSMQESEESKEQFRQLADFMPQIVWTSKPDGTVDYYNKRWYEFTGLPLHHTREEARSAAHPDDAAAIRDEWAAAAAAGIPFEAEHRFLQKATGTYRWLLIRSVPIRDKDGVIQKWFGTCTDIHDQKTATERLEAEVQERTEELKRSNDDLQQFAHVASHDLKEPLRKIRTFSSRLKDKVSLLPEKEQGYLEKIESAAARMSDMVEGILNYSIADKTAQSFETVEMAPLLGDIKNDLELVIQQKAATINSAVLPPLQGVPVLLFQLFYNLINNALKFSKEEVPNAITLTSRSLTPQESRKVAKGKEFVVIEVCDKGIGFDPEQSQKIFALFSRLNPKEKFEGTGLGLALCQKIAHRHGGFITATGLAGEGACFSVVLPLAKDASS